MENPAKNQLPVSTASSATLPWTASKTGEDSGGKENPVFFIVAFYLY
jgi:hypothetical protein